MKVSRHLLWLGVCVAAFSASPATAENEPGAKEPDPELKAPVGEPASEPEAAPDRADAPVEVEATSADAEIKKLIEQLSDEDFRVREGAFERLKQIGAPALPALEAAREGQDAEAASRADALIRLADRRSTLFGRTRNPDPRGIAGHRVHVSVINGMRVTEVFEGDQRIRISESPNEVHLSITAIEEGRQVTEQVRARDTAELQEKNPDAYAVYERWSGRGHGPVGLVPGGRRLPAGIRGPIIIRQAPLALPNPADDLITLRRDVRRQMIDANVPADRQREVLRRIDDLQAMQDDIPPDGAEGDARMRAYNAKSDELRTLLAELKLPDPGEALPPPAKSRLGISLKPQGGAIVVSRVLEGSRAAKMGIEADDVILRVNNKIVKDAKDLRRIVTDALEPLVIEGLREGKALKLEEKPNPAP